MSPEDQPLFQELRKLLRHSPVDFGSFVVTIHAILDGEDPDSDPGAPDAPLPHGSLHDMIESFITIDIAETTSALHVFATLVEDELLAARIRRALATRRQPVHPAIERFGEVDVTDAYLIIEPSGACDDLVLAARWPDGTEATLIVFVDHRVGGAVTDLIMSLDGNDVTHDRLQQSTAEEGLRVTTVKVADAAATLRLAMEIFVEEQPTTESDSWPAALPFLEFILDRTPAGGEVVGSADEWPEFKPHDDGGEWDEDDWDEKEEAELAHDFLESDEGVDPDDDLDHDLAHVVVRFATSLMGDPLSWSPPVAEMAMTIGLPVLLDDADAFARMPAIVRAFIRYAHAELGWPAEATQEVLETVDEHEAQFLAARTDPELIQLRADLEKVAERERELDLLGWGQRLLIDEVGSIEALDALTDELLPDEALDLTAVPEDVRDRVRRTAELTDRVADELVEDVEFRTACRRLLAMAAQEDPAIFRRRSRDDTAAAAVAWIVGRANKVFGWGGGLMVADLMEFLGLTGSPSQRAQPFLSALGVGPYRRYAAEAIGRVDLLTSATRRGIIERRDRIRGREA